MAVAAGISATAVALYVGAAAAAIGASVSIYGAFANAENQRKIADAQRRQKEIEMQVAQQNAHFEANQARRRATFALAREDTIFAAAGLSPGQGSPLALSIDQSKQFEMEALNIERGGKITSEQLQFESHIAKYRADLAKGAVPLEVAGALAQGAGQVSSLYGAYGQRKTPRVNRPSQTAFDQMYGP